MASRASLNKVLLIGNLTRDPELRYTPSGAAVCSFGLATNRVYMASDGTKKEEAEFSKIVAWNKLAELCSQLLTKGRKVYVEGRLQTRSWETPDGATRQTTEVVIDDMRILDSRRTFEEAGGEEIIHETVLLAKQPAVAEESKLAGKPDELEGTQGTEGTGDMKSTKRTKGTKEVKREESEDLKSTEEDELSLDDLPF